MLKLMLKLQLLERREVLRGVKVQVLVQALRPLQVLVLVLVLA